MTFLQPREYRTLARRLIELACNGPHGRPESDAFYKVVTEGKDPGVGHAGDISSCGFLPSWLWYRLGVRCSFVNRDENDRYRYRNGLNIALLSGENVAGKPQGVPNIARTTPSPSSRFECGDVLVIWNREDTRDAHTLAVVEHMDASLLSGNYGAPGAKLSTQAITTRQVHDQHGQVYSAPFLGQKQIRRWVPLQLVLQVAQQRGELVEPDYSPFQPDTEPSPPPSEALLDRRPRLEEGMRGAPVIGELQRLLNEARVAPALKVDWHFGPATRDALKAFQRAHGLKDDAICGPKTWAALLREGP